VDVAAALGHGQPAVTTALAAAGTALDIDEALAIALSVVAAREETHAIAGVLHDYRAWIVCPSSSMSVSGCV
jgi:hypothetical protein